MILELTIVNEINFFLFQNKNLYSVFNILFNSHAMSFTYLLRWLEFFCCFEYPTIIISRGQKISLLCSSYYIQVHNVYKNRLMSSFV